MQGSVISAERVIPETENKFKIALMTPALTYDFPAVQGLLFAARAGRHEVSLMHSGRGWVDFNRCWGEALRGAEKGAFTHAAMLHSDVGPNKFWLDKLGDIIDYYNCHIVSCLIPIKDPRGVTSSGIGDPNYRWDPLRRITMKEAARVLPKTFNEVDYGYPGGILLHNTGCWIADLRKPEFFKTDENGELMCQFKFDMRVIRKGGEWVDEWESEDWYFSRQLHNAGGSGYITREVEIAHRGKADYGNQHAWGDYDVDSDTIHKWQPKVEEPSHDGPQEREVVGADPGGADSTAQLADAQ